jgi:cyclophilin family peptidyl-prolyl cis-trans isomerase
MSSVRLVWRSSLLRQRSVRTLPNLATRTFAFGSRGSRGHGWYIKYREGRGGRHLQGEYFDRDSTEEQIAWNASVMDLGSQTLYMDVVVEPKTAQFDSPRYVPDLQTLRGEKHRLTMRIASTVLAQTSRNFVDLLTRYVGTRFYRIEPGVGLFGGDVLTNTGKTGQAANGLPLTINVEKDPLALWHVPGTISMVVPLVGDIDSRFILCTHSAPHMDGIHRPFGTLTGDCLSTVQAWESKLLTKKGVPSSFDLIVVECGLLEDEAKTPEPAIA